MLLATIDFIQYRCRRGRYGDHQPDGGMAVAHLDEIPNDMVSLLQEGDIIFTQRLNSWLSWAVMYFTSSPVDHAAIYIGNGHVIHATAAGVKTHSLAALTKGTRALPVSFAPHETEVPFNPPDLAANGVYAPGRPWSQLPMRWQFAWGGVRIITGFHPERFRWKFLADVWILAASLDLLLLLPLTGMLLGTVIAALVTVVAVTNFALQKLGGGRWLKPISHPDIGYRSFFRIGGIMVSKMGPLVVAEFGILPLSLFLALCREGPNDSAPDELKEIGERARDVGKRWGFCPPANKPKDQQRDQDEDKQI